jgi:hypothetical protein
MCDAEQCGREWRVMNLAENLGEIWRNLMANADSIYELSEEELEKVSAGLNLAVVVRSSNQNIVQTGNQLDVVVNNRVRAHLNIG